MSDNTPARFVLQHPLPTAAEAELLACVAEECSEITKEACKALRFGLDDPDPNDPKQVPNREKLALEYGNLVELMNMLAQRGIIDPPAYRAGCQDQSRKDEDISNTPRLKE